jgi:hypothetical protein
MRAHTPCERRGGQARQSTCRPHIRPSKNTHTHTRTRTHMRIRLLSSKARLGTTNQLNREQPHASCHCHGCAPERICATHGGSQPCCSDVCMSPHLCTTSTHKRVHSRPFIAYTHHTQITPLAPRATHSALPTGQHVPWTGEGRRFGCRHTSASAWPTQRSPRSLWMV